MDWHAELKAQAPAAVSFRSIRVGSEESFYWLDDRFGYALSANVNGADMQALAHGGLRATGTLTTERADR